jgi:hypothetical protein
MATITIGYTGTTDGYNNMNIAKVNNKDVVASSGVITSATVIPYPYQTITDCKVGIFYGTYSDITCREYVNLGTISNSNPITGLELECVAGDMIGQEGGGGGATNIMTKSSATADTWAVGAGVLMGCSHLEMTSTLNSVQAVYGEGNTIDPPTVTTQAVSDIDVTTATGNGNVTADGGATVTERGVCVALTVNPTTADTKFEADAGGTGAFTAAMTGLTSNTTYHARAYAINSGGTSYGSDVTFKTLKNSYALNKNIFLKKGKLAIQTKGITIPSWKADGKPTSPVNGEIGYNRDTHCFEIYDTNVSAWVDFNNFTQQTHETALKTDYTTGDLDSEAEIISAINATNTTVNSIITKLENLGLFDDGS